jgi:formylglycine-generating enzyme required for sulfatase activity
MMRLLMLSGDRSKMIIPIDCLTPGMGKGSTGQDGRYFPWGNEWRDDATNWGEKSGHTSAIGSYPLSRSVYEVEDMAGNVFEYTATFKEREPPPG